MQRNNASFHFPRRAELSVLFAVLLAAGCSNTAAGPAPPPPKPLAGTSLTFNCPDQRLRTLFEPMVRVWTRETGATVTVSAQPMNAESDLAILPAAELGAWAERGDLVPVPSNLREPGHDFLWSSQMAVFRTEPFAGWGPQLFGLPVVADTSIIVYRADRFAEAKIPAPTTWEALADAAALFTERDKKPGLPALDAPRLEDLFMRLAACYDRPALTGDSTGTVSLGFAFDLETGRPRMESIGMIEAARWLASLKKRSCVAEGNPDPVAALEEDRAVIAVLTLAELMKLKPEHKLSGRYGLAALPGTKSFVNPTTGRLVPVPVNRVPYLAGGQVAVVRRGCKNPDAAFALLADLASPARSQEIIAAGGYAPVRDTQLEPDRLLVWLGYGFNDKSTRQLQEIVRTNLGVSVRNPVYGLRSPDEAELRAALRAELVQIANGTTPPEAGLKRVNEKWGATLHPDWRRRAAGLN